MKLRTLSDIAELEGKKVLVRVDFNVPINKQGEVQDDTRIRAAIPTIEYLRKKGAKIILISHLGRPTAGELEEHLRLNHVAHKLSEILDMPVKKMDTVLGESVKNCISEMKNGELVMLENIRSHSEEKKCEDWFVEELAELGDIFVSDAFGTAHRHHASTCGLAEKLPAYAGLLIEKEIAALSPLLKECEKPLTMIFGGAKIDTKIGVIKNFIDKADHFLIGGGIANTFLYAQGHNVGASLCEEDKKETALEILEKGGEKVVLPSDVVVSTEISDTAEAQTVSAKEVYGEMKILDIGANAAKEFCEIIKKSKTVIWNGPVGLYEFPQFKKGTETIAKCLSELDCTAILGGGDTADSVKRFGIAKEQFTHISTGGGAAIEFLEGKVLPGIKCLLAN